MGGFHNDKPLDGVVARAFLYYGQKPSYTFCASYQSTIVMVPWDANGPCTIYVIKGSGPRPAV